jgi:2-oxoglutarate ferredoxin oxidoreductase subunit delta
MKIEIDRTYCKGCLLCVDACKRGVLALGQERSKGGYLMPAAVNPDACIACRMCEVSCPDVCIEVVKE